MTATPPTSHQPLDEPPDDVDDGQDFFQSSPTHPSSQAQASAASASTPQSSPVKSGLFRGGSDDDDEDEAVEQADEGRGRWNGHGRSRERRSSANAHHEHTPVVVRRKRMKLDHRGERDEAASGASSASAGPSRATTMRTPTPTPPPRASPPPQPQWTRKYIGHFCVAGWSLSKGRGYAEQGAKVTIQRHNPNAGAAAAQKKPPPQKKKQTKLNFGAGGAGKTGASLSNGSAAGKQKQKEDYVVRFGNMRGFEVGRLPTEVSVWVSKLMDLGIAHFEGYVVDCPPVLTVGCDVLLDIKAYLLRDAFPSSSSVRRSRTTRNASPARNFYEDTAETSGERELRQRKVALGRLFRACDLRPSKANDMLQQHAAEAEGEGSFGPGAVLEQYGGREAVLQGPGSGPRQTKGTSTPSGTATPTPATPTLTTPTPAPDTAPEGEEAEAGADPAPNDGTEMEQDEMAQVYSKAQRHDAELPEVDPPDTFALTLRPYQKQALGWMRNMEMPAYLRQGREGQRQEASLHPLWQEYRFPSDDEEEEEEEPSEEDGSARHFYFNPYIGEMSLEFQPASHGTRGGILADEMGLGKTIMVASLLHANRPPGHGEADDDGGDDGDDGVGANDEEDERAWQVERSGPRQTSLAAAFASRDRGSSSAASSSVAGRVTLVVAPMSLVGQWRNELERASQAGTLSVLLYYAEGKSDLVSRVEGGSVDVVVTSYGVLVSEYKRYVDAGGSSASARAVGRASPLFGVQWFRVILDEAHTIRNRSTRAARAAHDLVARRRWCLTGSPIVNRLTDLYSLLSFLRVEPWGDFSFFNSFIGKPFAAGNARALEIVQVILESILLRREKKFRDRNGLPIVTLPPKVVRIQTLQFSPLERRIYDLCFDRAWVQYQRLSSDGSVTRNLSAIFSVLMKLRQAVCHPLLVLQAMQASHARAREQGVGDLDEEAHEEVEALVKRYQAGQGEGEGEAQAEPEPEPEPEPEAASAVQGLTTPTPPTPLTATAPLDPSHFRSSTKLDALLRDLAILRAEEPTFKGVIFSQFTSFLDLVEVVLRRAGHPFLRLDGSTPQKEREAVLKAFAEAGGGGNVSANGSGGGGGRAARTAPPQHTLLLISLRAGGVGLNLTSARHVWLLDCWWNASTEEQAVDRVHRIGQSQEVVVRRYLIGESVEERILEIQRRKVALVSEALRKGGGAGAGAEGEEGKRERESETLENLRILFGEGRR